MILSQGGRDIRGGLLSPQQSYCCVIYFPGPVALPTFISPCHLLIHSLLSHTVGGTTSRESSGEVLHVGFVMAAGCSEVLLAYSRIHSLAAEGGGSRKREPPECYMEQNCPWENAFHL